MTSHYLPFKIFCRGGEKANYSAVYLLVCVKNINYYLNHFKDVQRLNLGNNFFELKTLHQLTYGEEYPETNGHDYGAEHQDIHHHLQPPLLLNPSVPVVDLQHPPMPKHVPLDDHIPVEGVLAHFSGYGGDGQVVLALGAVVVVDLREFDIAGLEDHF